MTRPIDWLIPMKSIFLMNKTASRPLTLIPSESMLWCATTNLRYGSWPQLLRVLKNVSLSTFLPLITPPVFAVYTSLLTLRWIEEQGGIEVIGEKNSLKANRLYNEVDRNPLFKGFASEESRSQMNVTFNLVDAELIDTFDAMCNDNGISGLKGHRSVGGYRASIYNALSIESVYELINCMQLLEQKN